jgi:hypothetical protein
VRASLADFTLCEAKFRDPKDKAAASVLDVDDDVAGRSGMVVGEVDSATVETDETLWEDPWRMVFCLRNCKALARAFSCVRTKPASCCFIVSSGKPSSTGNVHDGP